MNQLSVLDVVKDVLADTINNPEVRSMNDTASLKDDVGLDSMSSLTFLLALEERLEFTVDPATLSAADFQTIGSICDYINKQKSS